MIMARKFFRKLLPHPDVVTKNRWIMLLGPRLQDPSLWHINRRSCSLAVALGVFCAFIPIPFQMVIAAALAIWIRANILLTVPMVWISNPFTMGPMYFFCYLVGVEMLGLEPQRFHFEPSFEWLVSGLAAIWQPFLLGCFAVGTVTALASFILIRILWHLHILRHIQIRARRLHNRRRRMRKNP